MRLCCFSYVLLSVKVASLGDRLVKLFLKEVIVKFSAIFYIKLTSLVCVLQVINTLFDLGRCRSEFLNFGFGTPHGLTNMMCHCVSQCFSQNQSRQPVGPSDPPRPTKKSFSWQNKRQVSSYLEIRVGGGVCGRCSECESASVLLPGRLLTHKHNRGKTL